MIEVVSAVIIRQSRFLQNRILLTQRRADKDFPLMWECPGGKVEGNESHHDALRREVHEELGVDLAPIGDGLVALWCGEFHNEVSRPDRAHVFILFYPVSLYDDALPPRRQEGQAGIGWFTVKEIRNLDLAPGNKAAHAMIVDRMKR